MRFQVSLVLYPICRYKRAMNPVQSYIMTFIKTARNTNNSDLAPAPVAALVLSRLFSSPRPTL